MDRSDVIKLVSATRTKNSKGIYEKVEVEKQIFCSVKSVSMSEFFQGGQAGMKKQMRFDVFRYDYNDEEVLIYEGNRYSIYRTYIAKNDIFELYAEMDPGA